MNGAVLTGSPQALRLGPGSASSADVADGTPPIFTPDLRQSAWHLSPRPQQLRGLRGLVIQAGHRRRYGQTWDRDLMQSSGVRSTQGVLAVRARTSRYRGLPSSRRPRAVRGTVVTVNPEAVRSLRTACSGQVR